ILISESAWEEMTCLFAPSPALDPKDKATLIVPVSTTLDKGQYEVDWTALSVDGHKTQGKYTFTVK
ncbi:copper resistance protein CopC, partial [Klebsiella quasipneumoniae]|uniref:copper resistance protein CopC n=1 Tax=Klebsiella quasipneumoniae TaxID=1463165 RepID=UPI002E18526D|nr:copper resistance protein CopC [Klebsiella quasipneumoniae]